MPKATVGHLVYMIAPENVGFYRDLLALLGWQVYFDAEAGIGFLGDHDLSLWFMIPAKTVVNDYDGPGLNHLAFSVPAQSDVDQLAQFLTQAGIRHLFETPRHRPDFVGSPDQTYYQVMFESPDRILFEVVYTGPKA